MTRLWLLAVVVLCVSIPPVLAQDAADPAARIPDSASAYIEVRVDENLQATLQDLARLGALMNGESPEEAAAEVTFDAMLEEILPGTTFEDDILPWIGERVGMGLFVDFTGGGDDPDFAVVLPVTDTEAAAAFLTRLTPFFPSVDTEGEIDTYMNTQYQLVSTPHYIVGGTLAAMDMVTSMGVSLADNAAFVEMRAALPVDSLASGYISERLIWKNVSDGFPESGMGFPGPVELFETVMRLHPAESAMEDALLQLPDLNGVGFALEVTDERLDMTTVMSLDADYPAPTLSTASAGTSLLAYVPRDAYTVFTSYDALGTLGIGAGGGVGLAIMGPAIGGIFENIVAELNATPGSATPTPLPTPTPIPTPSADDLLTQAQPFVAQAEAFLGIELDALYELLAGEYAIAAFPVENPATENLGGALWIQTGDTARVGRLMDTVMTLAITQASSDGSTLPTRNVEDINGIEMVVWGVPGEGESLVYGALADDVFVVTLKSSLDVVMNASRGDGVLAVSRNWPGEVAGEYSSGLEAFTYVDIGGLMKLEPTSQTVPFTALIAGLDLQADGLFVGRMTVLRET